MPGSTVNGCLIMGGVAVAVAVGLGVYYYETQWRPYRNPPAVIKKISTMFEHVSPGSGRIPIKEGNESYTMNKSTITLCLKDPRTQKLYGWNTLAYVSLHELAHVLTKTREKDAHGPIFKKNFKELLRRAEALGLYNSSIPIPATYCET
jgi:hypothetical protein